MAGLYISAMHGLSDADWTAVEVIAEWLAYCSNR